jgi:hypothetical protein
VATPAATYARTQGIRHLMAAYDLNPAELFGHTRVKKDRTTFLEFCRYLRTLYPPGVGIAFVIDNFSPHLSTKRDTRTGDRAKANDVELAYVPANASWLNRIETQFQAPRYFTLDGTDHRSRAEQKPMIRRYIICRNHSAQDKTLREPVKRAHGARRGTGQRKKRHPSSRKSAHSAPPQQRRAVASKCLNETGPLGAVLRSIGWSHTTTG